MSSSDNYTINGTDLQSIHNRNELRVVKEIQALVDGVPGLDLSSDNLQDIYALALNAMPPRYTQAGTIVLREPVQQKEITKIVHEACTFVLAHPK